MAGFTQEKRQIAVTTPLGKDVLLLTAFTGEEELSRLFRFDLDMLSSNPGIAAKDIVGKSVTVSVHPPGGTVRYFNGLVSRFSAGSLQFRSLRQYRAEVVPWLWFLARTADCRIFQNKTAPDIVEQIFKDLGFSAYELNLKATYVKREYCVQYRETDFNFVSRLLEQEGIFYWFRHENGKHTLVLADQASAYKDCLEKDVEYSPGSFVPNHVSEWEHRYEFRPGKWAQTDYNFETPSTSLMTNTNTVVKLPGNDRYEVYDYPGEYLKKGDGEAATKVRMQGDEVPFDVVAGAGTCSTFTPGGKFTLKKHDCASEAGKGYVITSIRHEANEASYQTGEAPVFTYRNSFTCVPDAVTFRPARTTPEPVVQGPQTAVVVGPSGEEIYTDKYGRVKVQFFWDREGKKNENSSCWIRVAQGWAGKNWGIVFHPRVGQEVVVSFLEGDPDRPLITGRVYNADQMPPYELPKNQTQSTIKSRSSKGGGTTNFNELRFEDKKGNEQVFLHAEKDMDWRVKNDSREFVVNDRHQVIKGDHRGSVEKDCHLTVKGNRVEAVKQDHSVHVTGNRMEKIDQNASHQVGMKRQEKVGTNYALDAGMEVHIKGGMKVVIEAGMQLSLKAGANFIDIGPEGVAISGTPMVMINSGGSAGSGSGSSPQDPKDAKDPDVADDGTKVGKLN
jgi:type VI secretion system secreted protein VgrG